MNLLRIVKGEIYFDDFDNVDLDTRWLLIPNDVSRYSLIEKPGYLKIFHGNPDIRLLLDEPESDYILDIRNEYVPLNSLLQAGLTVFKSLDESLEVLEYYDATADTSIVYEYIRIVRTGNVYTAYGKNVSGMPWEIVGSGEFRSAGKVGLIVKGNSITDPEEFKVDYVRLYKKRYVQLVNLPLDFRVVFHEADGTVSAVKQVRNPYSGVSFEFEDVPPIMGYFEVFDETGLLVTTTKVYNLVGGDVFYYGASPLVHVNGVDCYTDGIYFLGYFTDNEISFTVELNNPYEEAMTDLILTAVQYGTDIGYKFVHFDTVIDGTYTQTSVTIPTLGAHETITIYGKIYRDLSIIPSSIDPFKFNLGLKF